jgi:hypothetical protein
MPVNSTVQELFDRVLVRIDQSPPVVDFYEAINLTVETVVHRLAFHRSDIVRSTARITFPANGATKPLPAGYIGMDGNPGIVGSGSYFQPAGPDTYRSYTVSGTPVFYEVDSADNLTLYPTPAVEIIVGVACFTAPPKVVSMDDDVPFGGRFDSIMVEVALRMARLGLTSLTDQAVQAMIYSFVDSIVEFRTPRDIRWSRGVF